MVSLWTLNDALNEIYSPLSMLGALVMRPWKCGGDEEGVEEGSEEGRKVQGRKADERCARTVGWATSSIEAYTVSV